MRRPFIRVALAAAVVALAAVACTEATDGILADAAGSTGTDAAAPPASGPPSADGGAPRPAFDAGTESAALVLINEISASGEWVELVNADPAPVDVSGWKLADRDKTTGGPKLDEAAVFPPATVLSPGAYLVVKGGGVDAGDPCPVGQQTYCVLAEFGISRKNGETIFLLLPDDTIVGSVVYPPTDAGADLSYSRVPSGTPDAGFEPRPATPGAAN